MKEIFYNKTKFSDERMKTLLLRSDNPSICRALLLVIMFLIVSFLVVVSWDKSVVFIVCSQIVFGILCCSLFALEHETVHGTAFKTKSLNRFFSLVVGFFHFYPPSIFKDLHFTHHRFTHIPGKDPEISIGNKPMPSILSNLGTYISWISGLPVLIFKQLMIIGGSIGMPELLRKNLFPFVHPKNKSKIAFECLAFMLGYVLFIYILLNVEPRLIAILIGQVIGHCFLSMYQSMEHNGLPYEGNVFNKTRSINTNKIVKLIMWNMPYHAEHHAFPAVPYHALPKLNEELNTVLIHKNEGPADFHKANFRKLLGKTSANTRYDDHSS